MTSSNPTFFNGLTLFKKTLVNADGTGFVTVYTPAQLEKIEMLGASSDDTAARDLLIAVQIGGTDYPICCIRLPIGAGTLGGATPGVPAIDMLDVTQTPQCSRDENGKPYLLLDATCTIRAKVLVAVTAAKTVTIFGHAKK